MSEFFVLDPNLAFSLLLVGALALLWELHAPGLIVPGLLGALCIAVGAVGIYGNSPSPYGVALLTLAAFFLLMELKFHAHMVSGLLGSILLLVGAILLFPGPRQIAPAFALAASLALGVITVFLGYLGMRSRSAKRLMGTEAMVGEIGVCQTALEPEGTVLVRGEYWRARSQHGISAGKRIIVEHAQDLTLFVKEA